MGRRIDVDLLVSRSEIAERLGYRTPENVEWWIRNDASFPAPVYTAPRFRLWYWPDVERWASRGALDERRRPRRTDQGPRAEQSS